MVEIDNDLYDRYSIFLKFGIVIIGVKTSLYFLNSQEINKIIGYDLL